MKRKRNVQRVLITLIILTSLCSSIFATTATAPQQYIDFVTGSVEEKTKLLNSLSISSDTHELVASIPERALEFIQETVPLVGTDFGMKELTLAAVPLLQVTGQRQSALLWNIFTLFDDSQVKVAVLDAMSETAATNKRLVSPYLEGIHTFVAETTATTSEDISASIAAINLLGQMADTSSFDILYRLMNAGTHPDLEQPIEDAFLALIPGSQTTLLRLFSQDNYSSLEKYRLFLLVQKNDQISPLFKAELAEKALSTTIIGIEDTSDSDPSTVSLQLAAVQQIADADWTRAGATVADYYLNAQDQFEKDIITQEQFLGVISCLEGLATSHTVAALIEHLGVLNMAAAQDVSSVNEEVLLAVIKSLGALGDKAAFDNLLYVTYLPYPETITTAARTALAGLKW